MADKGNKQSLVIDLGSGSVKSGFAGEETPKVVLPTIVGKTRFEDPARKKIWVGHEAISARGRLQLQCPVERGLIIDWDALEYFWHYTFHKELLVNPEEHPILLSMRPLCPTLQKEKMAQIMFETFNVPSTYFANQGVLSLYATAKTTGVVVDCGEGMSYSVPVFERHALSYTNLWLELGGHDVTEYLAGMLYSRGYNLLKFEKEKGWVCDMKEKLGYVSLDYDKELESANRRDIYKNYKLPDGQVIKIGEERFQCPEVLFQPYLMDKDADGIHEIINDSIMRCHEDIRNSMYESIVLCGGTTMLPGFAERIVKEMEALAPSSIKIKVFAPPERKYSVWIGGSILASLSSFKQMWISKDEYDESGATIVHRKCS